MKSFFRVSFIFLLILILHSCTIEKSTKELENNFTSREISELNKIIEFYKTQIGGQLDDKFEIVFKKQLDTFVANGKNDKIYSLDFDKQTQFYQSLKQEVFDEIWYYSEMIKVKYQEEYKTTIIQYQSESKYQDFLREVGRKNNLITEYKNIIGTFGVDTSTWLEQTILMNPKKFNLSDPNIQLIISIHYLTQNDRNKRLEILLNKIEQEKNNVIKGN